ncbi:MAG: AAA family ATPase [Bernardetiaceae bacterium]|nr:AAA family ATPase [Bernardetiaceae bacterium]
MKNADLELNEEAKQFLAHFNAGKSIFLTGKAGTGKTTLIQYLIENSAKNIAVVASTGIAAVNVGGTTIHSFFRLPFHFIPPGSDEDVPEIMGMQKQVIKSVDAIIIDEVSMVRADLLDAIEASLRKNGGNKNQLFGGKQIIFVGDLFQLQPIPPNAEDVREALKEFYPDSFYFFDAHAYQKLNPHVVELTKVYRQEQSEFLAILNRMRIGQITQEDIDKLNGRHEKEPKQQDFVIELATRKDITERRNREELKKLNTPEFVYKAEIEGNFPQSAYPTDFDLRLKVGAQIMFLRNDQHKRWINGTIARIESLSPELITVRMDNGEIEEIETVTWEKNKYKYDRILRKITTEKEGSFKQYPIKLAWSITIHKSQGLTFERARINFGSGAFASGQAYVALSRCTTLEGISLVQPIRFQDVKVDMRLKEFFVKLESR